MSYRIRFTLPDGRTGLWTPTYATREEAQRLIGERLDDTGFAYVVEEVVATAALPDATPEPSTPEARIRELEAELAQLRDAYDAARQDLDVAKRKVARLESTLAMVQASWAVSAANAAVANTLSAEAHCKTVASMVRLDRAIELGDAMHRANPSEEWAGFKETLAASRQGPAKASGGAGGTAHTGPGHQPGAGQGVASRLIVDPDAIEREDAAKASEAPGEGHHSGEGAGTP